MNKLALLAGIALLSGCTTVVPVVAKFPSAPEVLLENCGPLYTLKEGARLSDVMIATTENFMKYHECSAKHRAWIDWYNVQKPIFEQSTK